MPTKSKSPTTTKRQPRKKPLVARPLPTHQPPTHPGEMLLEEFVKPLGLTQTELAQRLGVSYPRLNEIVNGRRGTTASTALRIAKFFGNSEEFWLYLRLRWDHYQAKNFREAGLEEIQPLSA